MLELTGADLTIEEVVAVARYGEPVAPLGEAVRARMQASRDWVAASIQDETSVIYGVNTGFGPLANKRIAAGQARTLSRNVILACAVGVGPPLPPKWCGPCCWCAPTRWRAAIRARGRPWRKRWWICSTPG